MHACLFEAEVPAQHTRLRAKIDRVEGLSPAQKTRLLDALASLPAGDRVCHGDFHPANVLIDGKEARVIDWIDASRGNPLADVARTTILLAGAAASRQTSGPFLKVLTRAFHSAYRRHYFRLRPGGVEEYRRWLPIVAAARLSENISELEEWLIAQAASAT